MKKTEYINLDTPLELYVVRGGYCKERISTLRDLLDTNKISYTVADVRPVVLCKDCKWYEIDELKKDGTEDKRYKPSVCMLALQRRAPNHFCADGEKREKS